MNIQSNKSSRKSKRHEFDNLYQTISLQTRASLIEKVIIEETSVYRAAKQLNLNQSTAKAIVRRFRRNGSIYVRKEEQSLHGEVDRIKRLVSVREKNLARSTSGERSQEIYVVPSELERADQEDQHQNFSFSMDPAMLYYQYMVMNWNQLIFPVIF